MSSRRLQPLSPSPAWEASDKENEDTNIPRGRPNPARSMNKTQAQRHRPSQTQTQGRKRGREDADGRKFYDPEQSTAERVAIRRNLRSIQREINNDKAELVRTDNDKLNELIKRSEANFEAVKQTNDATIDSTNLVLIGEAANRKLRNMQSGSSSALGFDADEFISNVIGLANPEDERVELDWREVGLKTLHIHARPPTTDFMLGPLATTRKKRTVTRTQRARLVIRDEDKVRPTQLTVEDIKEQENKVAYYVQKTHESLGEYLLEIEQDCCDYFQFVINPHDYGQTIENIFYVAFLVKENRVTIKNDENGRLTLWYNDEDDVEKAAGGDRKQFITSMSMPKWRKLIKMFNITKSAIPHRPPPRDTAPAEWRDN